MKGNIMQIKQYIEYLNTLNEQELQTTVKNTVEHNPINSLAKDYCKSLLKDDKFYKSYINYMIRKIEKISQKDIVNKLYLNIVNKKGLLTLKETLENDLYASILYEQYKKDIKDINLNEVEIIDEIKVSTEKQKRNILLEHGILFKKYNQLNNEEKYLIDVINCIKENKDIDDLKIKINEIDSYDKKQLFDYIYSDYRIQNPMKNILNYIADKRLTALF